MKFDPHIHSIYSKDARGKVEDIIKQAKAIGLDCIAISDHDSIKGSLLAMDITKNMDDILVVPSIEITTNKGHVIGLGVKNLITSGLSPEETIEKIHDENGIAIIPHPFSPYRSGLFFKNKELLIKLMDSDSTLKDLNNLDEDIYYNTKEDNIDNFNESKYYKNIKIDGVEVLNARYIFGYSNYKANKLAESKNLAKIGASDSHFLESIGNAYTEIDDIEVEASVSDVLEAIRLKKTIAKGHRTPSKLILKEVINKKIKRIY